VERALLASGSKARLGAEAVKRLRTMLDERIRMVHSNCRAHPRTKSRRTPLVVGGRRKLDLCDANRKLFGAAVEAATALRGQKTAREEMR
jgi:hypothetical protein